VTWRTGLAWLVAAGLALGGSAALAGAMTVAIGGSASASGAVDLALTTATSQGPSDSLLTAARDARPFRPDRRAPVRPYDPVALTKPAEPTPPALPKPTLRLAGLLWSAAPVAILEGIPGREGGVALGTGDSAGGLQVRRIERTQVRVVGYDTVWVLAPKGTWVP
jgi:hypothetical protein